MTSYKINMLCIGYKSKVSKFMTDYVSCVGAPMILQLKRPQVLLQPMLLSSPDSCTVISNWFLSFWLRMIHFYNLENISSSFFQNNDAWIFNPTRAPKCTYCVSVLQFSDYHFRIRRADCNGTLSDPDHQMDRQPGLAAVQSLYFLLFHFYRFCWCKFIFMKF